MRTWCFACVVVAWWCVAAAGGCDVTIGDRRYTEEMLVNGVAYASGLAVDFNTHCLYLSFYNETQDMLNNARVDIISKAFSVIGELSEECWFTVDQGRGEVHAGCSTERGVLSGLYQWDSNTGQFELAGEAGRGVAFVYYHNDTLYYSADSLLHTFTHGQSARLSVLASGVWHFALDAQGEYIFTNATGVYRRRESGEEVRYPEVGQGALAVAVDGRGAAYTCGVESARGVWRLYDRAPATRLLDVACGGLTFDADGNMIYADWSRHSVLRLVPC